MSPRVDFYILEQEGHGGGRTREQLSCRLAEKAWKSGHHVFLLVDSPVALERMDELLWTFRDESFVPHMAATTGEPFPDMRDAPIVVGAGEVPEGAVDVLINLTENIPSAYTQFARVAEIIDASELARSAGRERFRYYREHECEVHAHNL